MPQPSLPSARLPLMTRGAPQFTDRSVIVVLTAVAAALSIAFVYAPRQLADGSSDLVASTRDAVTDYWRAGETRFTAPLDELVDYWARFHAVKALAAGLLVIVVIALAMRLRRIRLQRCGVRGPRRGVMIASEGSAAAVAVVSLVLLMANLQGVAAPFSSLMSLLPVCGDDSFAPTAAAVRQQLADHTTSAPLAAMIDDFARYHAVLAVMAAAIGLTFLAVTAAVWRTRSLPRRVGAVSMVLVVAFIGLAVVNAMTAADPGPALLSFFGG